MSPCSETQEAALEVKRGESQRCGFLGLTAGACCTAQNNKDEDFKRRCSSYRDNRGDVQLKGHQLYLDLPVCPN